MQLQDIFTSKTARTHRGKHGSQLCDLPYCVGMQPEQRLPLGSREPQHKSVIQVLARAWVHHTAHCRPVQSRPARLDALSTLCHAWGNDQHSSSYMRAGGRAAVSAEGSGLAT